jgi:hypothetical protein
MCCWTANTHFWIYLTECLFFGERNQYEHNVLKSPRFSTDICIGFIMLNNRMMMMMSDELREADIPYCKIDSNV